MKESDNMMVTGEQITDHIAVASGRVRRKNGEYN